MKFAITKQQATSILAEMEERTHPGNKVCDEVEVDENANVTSFGYTCDKEGCNCTGGWWDNRDVGDGIRFSISELENIVNS